MAKNINFDVLTQNWVLNKFLNSWQYNEAEHGGLGDMMILNLDSGWECECYSEYTRNDQYALVATIRTKAGEIEYRYGTWGDLPSMLQELMNMEDLADECSIEREEREEEDSW